MASCADPSLVEAPLMEGPPGNEEICDLNETKPGPSKGRTGSDSDELSDTVPESAGPLSSRQAVVSASKQKIVLIKHLLAQLSIHTKQDLLCIHDSVEAAQSRMVSIKNQILDVEKHLMIQIRNDVTPEINIILGIQQKQKGHTCDGGLAGMTKEDGDAKIDPDANQSSSDAKPNALALEEDELVSSLAWDRCPDLMTNFYAADDLDQLLAQTHQVFGAVSRQLRSMAEVLMNLEMLALDCPRNYPRNELHSNLSSDVEEQEQSEEGTSEEETEEKVNKLKRRPQAEPVLTGEFPECQDNALDGVMSDEPGEVHVELKVEETEQSSEDNPKQEITT